MFQVIGGVVAFVLVLILGVLLFLQTNWGAETGARFILRQVDPFSNATIHIGSVRGNEVPGGPAKVGAHVGPSALSRRYRNR